MQANFQKICSQIFWVEVQSCPKQMLSCIDPQVAEMMHFLHLKVCTVATIFMESKEFSVIGD